jgi:8-oxo-dGTP pyrophosphatase MutT (NUDIX family)
MRPTIVRVSAAEEQKGGGRRRKGRRQPPGTGKIAKSGNTASGRSGKRRARTGKGAAMRTVHETSAGGLVLDRLDGPTEQMSAVLIGRIDRRGQLLWSLPKGHIEQGETAEQTAIREVAEETGIAGRVLAELGSIDYWFIAEGRRVHKTVHHYLLASVGGELSDDDVEVAEVAWVPLPELQTRLAYADERRLAARAGRLIDTMGEPDPDDER